MYAKYLAPRYSGAGRQALALAAALRAQGVAVTFLTEATPQYPGPYDVEGFRALPFFPATDGTAPLPGRALAFGRALKALNDVSVFHAHSAYPEASLMGLTARALGVPALLKVTMHRSDVHCSQSRVLGPIHRQMLLRQNGIVAISSEIEAELLALGVRASRIVRIPNGVDLARFRPSNPEARAVLRRRFQLPETGPVVAFAGMLIPRKNVGLLLDAWQSWRAGSGVAATLLLAGPESAGESVLASRVAALNADPASGVRWVGQVADVEAVYAVADVFVLASESEGLPNVALEAMATGVPVILGDSSGSRDVLGPGMRGGWLVPEMSVGSLARALTVISDPALPARGREARQRVEAAFSLERVASEYREVYQRLVSGLPPVGAR